LAGWQDALFEELDGPGVPGAVHIGWSVVDTG
jgi:hypothetical protein